MRLTPSLVLVALAVAALPGSVSVAIAQTSPDRVRLSINGGVHSVPGSITQEFPIRANVESGQVATDLTTPASGFFDAGARVRIASGFSAGVSWSVAAGSSSGTVTAQIPHPFYFNQPREISADLDGLEHAENGVHVELAWAAALSRAVELTVFGGPSYITLRQDLVTDVAYAEEYPYDAVTYSSATTVSVTESALGYHAGADLTWRLSRALGIAGLVRYSRASMTLSPAPGNTVDVDAGGIQAGGGLRIYF